MTTTRRSTLPNRLTLKQTPPKKKENNGVAVFVQTLPLPLPLLSPPTLLLSQTAAPIPLTLACDLLTALN